MPYETALLLFFSGILSGGVSALAGGSALITFPILVAAGLPPIIANATNFMNALPANVGTLLPYRSELKKNAAMAWRMTFASMLGGAIGCLLLLNSSNEFFIELVPWFMAIATFFLAFGKRLNALLEKTFAISAPTNSGLRNVNGFVLIFLFAIYGGYFGAGLGIIMLALIHILGFTNYHEANALKNLNNAVIGGLGVLIYSINGLISWPHALSLMAGALLGGFFAIRIARFIPQELLSKTVVVYGVILTIYYFSK